MNNLTNKTGIEIRTVGDSKGYLWKVIIDNDRGIGRIEKLFGLSDALSDDTGAIDGSEHALKPGTKVPDGMQVLTKKIESRIKAA